MRIRRLFRIDTLRPNVEQDVRSEIELYLELRAQEFVDAGLPPADARAAARRAFGDVAAVERECRAVTTGRVRARARTETMHSVMQDLRFAARTLRRNPGFTLVAVLTLALGIGANTAIFSVINGIMLRTPAYGTADRLVRVERPARASDGEDAGFSATDVHDYRAGSRSLAALAEYHSMTFNLVGRSEPLRVQTGVVSANYFDVLGVAPLLGRTFRAGDDSAGSPPVLVVSHAFWQSRLGGDPNVVGQTFEMTDRVHTVVGVLPPLPAYPDANDVYMPTTSCPFRSSENARGDRDHRMVTMFAALRPGVAHDAAERDLAALSTRLYREYPQAYPAALGFGLAVRPVPEELVRGARPTLVVLLATAGFVLLIACANVANLTLVRLVGRHRELSVRAALGAGRARLVRQLLTESTLLALAGAALGLLLASGGLELLRAFATRVTPRAHEIRIDGAVLLFTLAVAVGTGLVFGALPFLSTSRDLSGALRTRGTGGGRGRLESALVVSQLAVTVMLLVAAGLMLRSLRELNAVDAGFDARSVLTARVTPSRDHYPTREARLQFHERLLERVAARPGVTHAAFAGTVPLNDEGTGTVQFRIEGRPADAGEPLPQAELHVASAEYFATIGLPVLDGRAFTSADRDDAPDVVIVNRTAARRYWGSASPVGQRITNDGGETWNTVVGVVGDVKQNGLDRPPEPEVYAPLTQFPITAGTLLLRTRGEPMRLARAARAEVAALDPRVPVDQVRTLEQVRDESLAARRITASLIGLFAALALVISATGIGGVIAFSVAQRTNEIGVRMALGAATGQVVRMVLRQSVALAALGLALGVAGALVFGRLMAGLVFGVGTADPLTFVGVAAVMLVVAAAACWAPARRATRIDPMVALRSE